MGTRPVPRHRLHGEGKDTSLFHDVRAALPCSGAAPRGKAAVSFAKSPAEGGKASFVGRENRPHPRARSFLSHINRGANTGTGIPPPCCPQGRGLALMEGARWALAAGTGRGGRAASAAPAGGTARVAQGHPARREEPNPPCPAAAARRRRAAPGRLCRGSASWARGQDGDGVGTEGVTQGGPGGTQGTPGGGCRSRARG